jgi:hypothetical protein
MSVKVALLVTMAWLAACGRPPPAPPTSASTPGPGAPPSASEPAPSPLLSASPFVLTSGLAGLAPPGYTARGVERVGEGEDLFERVGLLASFITPRGHRETVCQRYTSSAAPPRHVGVCVHVTRGPLAAMAVFLRMRRLMPQLVTRPEIQEALALPPEAEVPDVFRHLKQLVPAPVPRLEVRASPLGAHAWETSTALFMVQGDAYVEIFSDRSDEPATQARRRLANELARRYAGTTAEAPPFPEAGMGPEGVQVVTTNAFGLSGLNDVYTAMYARGDDEAMAFWSRRASASEAEELARSWRDLLRASGAAPAAWTLPGATVLDIFGFVEVVCVRGDVLAGVHQASAAELARGLAEGLCPQEASR